MITVRLVRYSTNPDRYGSVAAVTDDDLRLRPMTSAELSDYRAQIEERFAADVHTSAKISIEAARVESHLVLGGLFPEGGLAPGAQIWVAEDTAGARVGILWLAHREAGTPTEHAWIYDIAVDEARRGSGWGRKLLAQAEEQTRALGLTSLRLNVFGENTVARNLYRSQGFTESRVTMIKDV